MKIALGLLMVVTSIMLWVLSNFATMEKYQKYGFRLGAIMFTAFAVALFIFAP